MESLLSTLWQFNVHTFYIYKFSVQIAMRIVNSLKFLTFSQICVGDDVTSQNDTKLVLILYKLHKNWKKLSSWMCNWTNMTNILHYFSEPIYCWWCQQNHKGSYRKHDWRECISTWKSQQLDKCCGWDLSECANKITKALQIYR